MKRAIVSVLKNILPQGVKDSLFHLGFQLAPEEFRKFAHEYAFAPDMERGLKKLRDRGFAPQSIVDVGAYHGDWSATCHNLWPAARITMIEANKEKEPILQPVARRMGADLHFALLGPEDGKDTAFYVMESGSSVFEENSPVDRSVEHIPTIRLDSVLKGQPVDFLKIDTQGFELEVLRGGKEAFSQAGAVLLEVSLLEINRGAPLLADVVGFMKSNGFIVCDILEIHRRPLDRATNQVDLLFVPETSPLMAETRHF